jgi:hypothetical protein
LKIPVLSQSLRCRFYGSWDSTLWYLWMVI